MYDTDKETIINRYNERLEKHGGDIGTLAVGNMERQFVRYDILSRIGDISNSSVLDLGCGFGDFYGFLLAKGLEVDYVGCDMNEKLIEVAQKKYPSAKFEVNDFFTDDANENYDYVISSSAFNNNLEGMDNYDFIKKIIGKAFDICNKGVSINLMTDYVDYKVDHAFYYSPEELFKFARTLTDRVTLRNDYGLYEFTLYLYKGECDWKMRQKGG